MRQVSQPLGGYTGAVDESRARLKPEIPTIGDHGIPLRDELELEQPVVPVQPYARESKPASRADEATSQERRHRFALDLAGPGPSSLRNER